MNNSLLYRKNRIKNELLGRFTSHLIYTLNNVNGLKDYETIIDELTNKLNDLEDDLGYN